MSTWEWVKANRPDVKEWRGEKFFIAQRKLDGWRCTVVKQGGLIRAVGRNANSIDMAKLKRHERIWAQLQALPDDTVVDGELHAGVTAPSSRVPTALKFPASGELQFTAFSVPHHRGVDLRTTSAAENIGILIDLGLEPPEHLTASQVCAVADMPIGPNTEQAMRDLLKCVAANIRAEGFVLKLNAWMNWWRVKRLKTADLLVVGTKPGKGKFAGMVGSLELAARKKDGGLCTVANASGMDDETRALCGHGCVGKVVEVEFDSVGDGGKLRFPRFVRWREDKDASQVDDVAGLRLK